MDLRIQALLCECNYYYRQPRLFLRTSFQCWLGFKVRGKEPDSLPFCNFQRLAGTAMSPFWAYCIIHLASPGLFLNVGQASNWQRKPENCVTFICSALFLQRCGRLWPIEKLTFECNVPYLTIATSLMELWRQMDIRIDTSIHSA